MACGTCSTGSARTVLPFQPSSALRDSLIPSLPGQDSSPSPNPGCFGFKWTGKSTRLMSVSLFLQAGNPDRHGRHHSKWKRLCSCAHGFCLLVTKTNTAAVIASRNVSACPRVAQLTRGALTPARPGTQVERLAGLLSASILTCSSNRLL